MPEIKQAREDGSMEGEAAEGLGRSRWILELTLRVPYMKMEPMGFASGLRKTKVCRMTPSFWPEHLASQSCPLS